MQLDRFQVSLRDRGIATSNQEKTMAAGAQMWQSEMFTEDQMVAWENRTSAMQMWTELQTYFTEKVAGTKAVFCHHSKAITVQGSSTPSSRCCNSGRGRRDAGDAIRDVARSTHEANRPNGGDKQGKYGGHDGKIEFTCRIKCHQTNPPTRQGKHSTERICQTPRQRRRASKEAPPKKGAMPQL